MNGRMEELVIYGKPTWGSRRQRVDVPIPGPKEVLVKVMAVGLNPKDWKYTEDLSSSSPLNTGDDITGIVTSIGPEIYDFKPGDRVAGLHLLGEPHGGYAEYALIPAAATFFLPPSISFEAGATVPLVGMTAAIAMYQALKLPPPTQPPTSDIPILIYGGSTAVGAIALQLAKLSRLNPIITVCGAGIELVKSLDAATHIIDYRLGDSAYISREIRKALNGNPLLHAFDTVGQNGSWAVCGKVLAHGGHLEMIDWGHVLDWDETTDAPGVNAYKPPEDVELNFTLVSSAHGIRHDFISEERAVADGDFGFMWFGFLGKLLAEGRVRTHPVEVVEGGLDGILGAVRRLREGRVTARKLVVRIEDTPGLESKA